MGVLMRGWPLALAVLVAVLAAVRFPPGVRAARIPLVVVVHPRVKATSAHIKELRAIFLKQSEQLDGEKVIPITYVTGHVDTGAAADGHEARPSSHRTDRAIFALGLEALIEGLAATLHRGRHGSASQVESV